jgi:cytochrome P450
MAFPPGPQFPRVVQVLKWGFRPGPFLEECQRNYGDLFSLRLEPQADSASVVVADPDLVKKLFQKPALTVAGETRTSMAGVFGHESVLLTDGELHASQRKWVRPGLQPARLDQHKQSITDAIDRAIDEWPLGRPFSIRPSLQAAGLKVIMKIVFGRIESQRSTEIEHQVDRLLGLVANRSAFLALALPERLRNKLSRKALDGPRKALDNLILQEVDAHTSKCDDLSVLSHLLSGAAQAGVVPTEEAICDQIRTLLLTGHESTATSLAWTIAHLVQKPDALNRLTTEVRDIEDGTQYADAILSESLRLTPPLASAQRKLTVPLETNGYFLPPGTLIAPCSYLLHRRADLYPDPHAFRPERFLTKSPALSWIPFGGGTRRCLGASVARLQLNMMLCRICQRTRLRSGGSPEGIRRRGIVLAPAQGGRVVVVDRR